MLLTHYLHLFIVFLSLEEKRTFRLSLGSILQKLFQNMSVCCINYVRQKFSRLQYFFEAVFLAKYVSLHNLPLYEQLCGENGITHHNIFFSGINPQKYANPVSIVSIANNSGGNTFSFPISIVIKKHIDHQKIALYHAFGQNQTVYFDGPTITLEY